MIVNFLSLPAKLLYHSRLNFAIHSILEFDQIYPQNNLFAMLHYHDLNQHKER